MDLKKKLLIGFLVVGVALTAVAGISFAAGSNGLRADGAKKGFAAGCCGVFTSLADTLGLKPDQIIEKRNNGESLAAIAKEQNVSQEALVSAILQDRKKILDQRVKAGQITQDEETAMLDTMKTRISLGIKNKAGGPGLCAPGKNCGPGCYKPDQHGPRSSNINTAVQGPY